MLESHVQSAREQRQLERWCAADMSSLRPAASTHLPPLPPLVHHGRPLLPTLCCAACHPNNRSKKIAFIGVKVYAVALYVEAEKMARELGVRNRCGQYCFVPCLDSATQPIALLQLAQLDITHTKHRRLGSFGWAAFCG